MTAWPPAGRERLAAAVTSLAERVEAPEQRAQLHALAGVVRNLGGEAAGADARARLEHEALAALEAGDEERALRAARELAALDRAAVAPVDWSAASGG